MRSGGEKVSGHRGDLRLWVLVSTRRGYRVGGLVRSRTSSGSTHLVLTYFSTCLSTDVPQISYLRYFW